MRRVGTRGGSEVAVCSVVRASSVVGKIVGVCVKNKRRRFNVNRQRIMYTNKEKHTINYTSILICIITFSGLIHNVYLLLNINDIFTTSENNIATVALLPSKEYVFTTAKNDIAGVILLPLI